MEERWADFSGLLNYGSLHNTSPFLIYLNSNFVFENKSLVGRGEQSWPNVAVLKDENFHQ